MKKNLLTIASALLLSISLASCDGRTVDGSSSTATSDTATTTTTGTTTTGTTTTGTTTTTTTTTSVHTMDEVLAQLKGVLSLKGDLSMLVKENGIVVSSQKSVLEVLVSPSHYFNRETGDSFYITDMYLAEDGTTVEKSVDPTTGEVSESVSYYDIAEYQNPFADLTVDDLTLGANHQVAITLTEDEFTKAGAVLTMYGEASVTFQTAVLTIDDDYMITEMTFTGVSSEGVESEFACSVIDESELSIPVYERTETHEEIDSLFSELKKGNYTFAVEDSAGVAFETKVTSEGFLIDDQQGYILTDEGLADFEVVDGKLVGSSPATSLTMADVVPPFDYLSSMFDKDGDVYTLPAGLGLDFAIENILPEAAIYDPLGYGIVLVDDGSYTLTNNQDGTWTASYTSSDPLFGSQVTVEVTISEIGTTLFGYTLEDYVEPAPQTSWADVDYALELLELAGIAEEDLPFYLPEGGYWQLDTENLSDLILSLPSDVTATQALTTYTSMLVNAGWEQTSTSDYGTSFSLDTGEPGKLIGNITLEAYDEDGLFVIWFEDPTLPETENKVGPWIDEHFADPATINYTMEFDSTLYYYEVDQETQIKLDDVADGSQGFGTSRFIYTKDAMLTGKVSETNAFTPSVLYLNTTSGLSVYTYSTGTPTLAQSYPDYTYQADLVFTMADFVGMESLLALNEDGTQVEVLDDYDLYYLLQMTQFGLTSGGEEVELTPVKCVMTLDETANELQFTLTLEDQNYLWWLDQAQTKLACMEVEIVGTIKAIGTTTIDETYLPSSL